MATQKDLAKLAGVSAGTVSNVISGSIKVSEKARDRVLKAVRELNYQPNPIARSLKTNRTNTLGIIVPDITIPFFPKVIRGAESAARSHDYLVLVLDSQGSQELELEMLALLRQRVDGILLVTAGYDEWSAASFADAKGGPPIIYVDRLPESLNADSVCVDNVEAAEIGVAHLISVGHRKIAIITGPLTLRNEQERLRGYRKALQAAGIPIQESLIWASTFEREEIQRACQNGFLRSKVKPTAIFVTNGVTGVGALESTFALGLSTPADLGFAMIDEICTEEFFRPRVTSVIQPTGEIGRLAVELALKRVSGVNSGEKPVNINVHATLVVRETSGLGIAGVKDAVAHRR